MKNIKTKAIAASLATLMVASVGMASVSAAETTTQDTTRTYYFIDNKDWGKAACYAWDVEEDGSVQEESAFPGTELTAIGTTTALDGKEHLVFEVEVNTADDYFVIDAFCDHCQQSDDINNHLCRDGANAIYLSNDNDAEFRHLTEDQIQKFESTATFASARNYVETRTVFFINNKGWDTVCAYTWEVTEDGVVEDAAFPGVPVTKVGTTTMLDGETAYELYMAEVPATADGLIFSEGTDHGQQTKDIDLTRFYDGANVFYLDVNNVPEVRHMDASQVQCDEHPVAPLSARAASETVATRTFYFVNNKDWENVFCYSWKYNAEDGSPVDSTGAFPGMKAEKVGTTTKIDGQEHDVYAVEVPVSDFLLVLSEGTEHGQQSKDFMNLSYDGANMIYLTRDNYAEVVHCDSSTDIVAE